MALPTYAIEFHHGETFELSITYKDSTGCALDLSSGYTAKIDGRLTPTDSVVWDVTNVDQSGRIITLSKGSPNIHILLPSAYTDGLTVGSGVWDLKLEKTSGSVVDYVLGGTYKILDPVTP
tara:strand:- start:37 stop:399 length:363 start_codon:yes stop_codon:yes gene_type:complete